MRRENAKVLVSVFSKVYFCSQGHPGKRGPPGPRGKAGPLGFDGLKGRTGIIGPPVRNRVSCHHNEC